ncbi:hypothetical protein IF2G_03487 [Cordyceps javanica]|nr:hypothetical protein IF2G_03487 [Cordyceps javanica]
MKCPSYPYVNRPVEPAAIYCLHRSEISERGSKVGLQRLPKGPLPQWPSQLVGGLARPHAFVLGRRCPRLTNWSSLERYAGVFGARAMGGRTRAAYAASCGVKRLFLTCTLLARLPKTTATLVDMRRNTRNEIPSELRISPPLFNNSAHFYW